MLAGKVVGNYEINLIPTKAPQGTGSAILGLLDKTNQVFQISNFGSKACGLYSVVVGKSEFLKELGTIFNGGLTMSGLTYAPVTIVNAYKSLITAFNGACELPGACIRKGIVALRQVSTSISTIGFGIGPFLKAYAKSSEVSGNVITLAKGAKLVSDSCALVESGQDFWTSRNLSIEAEQSDSVMPEIKESLVETNRMNFLKLTKAVCSVAGFALGLGFVSAAFAATPAYAVGVATVSLLGSILGIGSSIYATQMKYKQIDFFSTDSVGYIAPAVEVQEGKQLEITPTTELATA